MQFPSNSDDPFIRSMSDKGESIRHLFLEHVRNLTKRVPVKVMLGDGTVSDQESFDPANIRRFYETVLKKLSDWTSSGVSSTTDQDLRRSFIKFETTFGKYALSCHMSLQYHALLFYKPDHRVIEIQKELVTINENLKHLQEERAPINDKSIEEKLRAEGYENLDQQKLFEILFERDDLTQKLTNILDSSQHKINEFTEKQETLLKELDNLLIEIYHTNPVMIDEMKMIAAEEGCLCNFNLEYMKSDKREGNIDLTRISPKVKTDLLNQMNNVEEAVKF